MTDCREFNGTVSTTSCSIKCDFKILICDKGTWYSRGKVLTFPKHLGFNASYIQYRYLNVTSLSLTSDSVKIWVGPPLWFRSHVKPYIPSASHHHHNLHYCPINGTKSEILPCGCSKKLLIIIFALARQAEVKMVKDHTQSHKLHEWCFEEEFTWADWKNQDSCFSWEIKSKSVLNISHVITKLICSPIQTFSIGFQDGLQSRLSPWGEKRRKWFPLIFMTINSKMENIE